MEALDQARVAKRKAKAEGESDFLKGKQLNLEFFIANFLPRTIAAAKGIQAGDESCVDPALFC
jgi:hypothetical protein